MRFPKEACESAHDGLSTVDTFLCTFTFLSRRLRAISSRFQSFLTIFTTFYEMFATFSSDRSSVRRSFSRNRKYITITLIVCTLPTNSSFCVVFYNRFSTRERLDANERFLAEYRTEKSLEGHTCNSKSSRE